MKDYLINKRLKELCSDGHLSNEDNIKLFQQYKQDKLNNIPLEDSEARTLLILGNQKLMYFVLKSKFGLDIASGNLEEASVGQIGLVKSVDTFNVDSGIKFTTYACKVIMNEVRMYYRKLNNKSNIGEQTKVFLDDYVNDTLQDGAPVRIMDTLSDNEDFVTQVAEQDFLDRAIKHFKYLHFNEALTVAYYFGLFGLQSKNQAEIAEMLNISRSYVSRHLSKGLKKIKVLTLNEEDLTQEEVVLKYSLLKKGVQNTLVEQFKGFKMG